MTEGSADPLPARPYFDDPGMYFSPENASEECAARARLCRPGAPTSLPLVIAPGLSTRAVASAIP